MEFIPTNDVFHHLTLLLRLHKDQDYIISLFAKKGFTVSKSQIKAWRTKTGEIKNGYRPMPRDVLDAFISALHEDKLISGSEV